MNRGSGLPCGSTLATSTHGPGSVNTLGIACSACSKVSTCNVVSMPQPRAIAARSIPFGGRGDHRRPKGGIGLVIEHDQRERLRGR